MKTAQINSFVMDGLESRTLLSAGHHGGHHLHIPKPPSAAVQADLDAIKTDTQQLRDDRAALASTLKTDRIALRDAIKAVDVTALTDTLKADSKTWADTLRADRQAVRAAKGDDTALAAAKAQLSADRADAYTAIKADRDAIKAAIDADPAVIAAKDQLASDSQPITDDLAKLKADKDQLVADIKAQNAGTV